MKSPFLSDSQGIYCIFQTSPQFHIFVEPAEKLLYIIVRHRPRKKLQKIIISQIPLKLSQILHSPGAENKILSAPVQKIPDRLRKSCAAHKVFVIHMDYAADTIMDPLIHLRFDQSLKLSGFFSFFIKPHCPDLYDLKGHPLI